jgi:hypothetical protein
VLGIIAHDLSDGLNRVTVVLAHGNPLTRAAGEILFSETIYAKVAERFPNLEERALALRGKEALMNARVLGVA